MSFESKNIKGVIHAKGNSERILRKNFCLVNGVPLFLCQALNLALLICKENVYIDSEKKEIMFRDSMVKYYHQVPLMIYSINFCPEWIFDEF